MSAKITGQVWDLQLPRMEAWILFAMADHAHHDGTHVFPSQALIAWKTGYSIRQIRRVQDELKRRKILIPEGSGYRGVQHYRLDFSQVPLKPPFSTRDKMSVVVTEDKMSVVKKPHVNKLLQTTEDKMSVVTEDKMSVVVTEDKMSSEDISDTTTDIFDRSPIKDARAEPSLEPSLKEKENELSADDPLVQPKKPKKVPKSQEPGELHPNTIEAVQNMMVQRFHTLAAPTKDNEVFWDAQIAYILEANAISFTTCLKKVDAYWASNPDKVAMKAPGLRKQMRRGIEIEVEKAQRAMKGTRRYG